MELIVHEARAGSPRQREVEVVERKGLGHPDSICDAIAEKVCVRLCRYYLDHFGVILHHNVDKVLLCGGAARVAFGGGTVDDPRILDLEVELAGSPLARAHIRAVEDIVRDQLGQVDALRRDLLQERVALF